MRTEELFYWIKERHRIFIGKKRNWPKPWTQDTILQNYRFCNPYRENDKVTQWIGFHWRDQHRDDPYLWFAMVVARLINLPESLEVIGYPVPWCPAQFKVSCEARKASGNLFNGAYIVSTNGRAMDKVDYLIQYVLEPLWAQRVDITDAITSDPTLTTMHKVLVHYDGLGSFMAGQIVADMKYVAPWRQAEDWYSFAASGPGSRRGLNRVMGRPVSPTYNEAKWFANLTALHEEIGRLLIKNKLPALHAQDLQNCLCEFDKYERARLGEGTPKSKYPGAK